MTTDKDSERIIHRTQISDHQAKPLLGRLSGQEILVLIATIVVAVMCFWHMTTQWKIPAIWSLLPSAALPAGAYLFLVRFITGRPEGYLRCWIQTQVVKSKKDSLLTSTHDEKK